MQPLSPESFELLDKTVIIENVKSDRYLFSDGPPIKGKRGAEGGWSASSGFESPRIVGADANYYNRALWIIRRQGRHFLIENVETKRYLFARGPKIKGKRGAEGGWSASSGFASPNLQGTDANYYNRALWTIYRVGSHYIIENAATQRYLFGTGPRLKRKRGSEGGWKASSGFESPGVVGADANYYNMALWKIFEPSDADLETYEESIKPDDLTKIAGIGRKVATLLENAGIATFAKLAASSADDIAKILATAGKPYAEIDPTTWPEQAKLAAAGKWDELKALQDELNAAQGVVGEPKYRILSLDGGTHGFTWLYCLREIEEDNPGFLAQTDMFTGSSFGGFCSLYLARHMGALKDGESALGIIDGCIAFMKKLLAFDPDQAAFGRLLAGAESMYSHDRMESVLTHPDHLGDACLGDMHRRVVITTYGTHRPTWGPRIYDSDVDEDKHFRASELGLESAALPVILPGRNGLCNGSLGGSNGSLHGLTHVIRRDSVLTFDDVVLLSMGGDPGTSNLADFPTPWDSKGAIPQKVSFESLLQPSPEKAQALAMLNQKVDALWKDLDKTMTDMNHEDTATSTLGTPLTPPEKDAPEVTNGSTPWGWRRWLTDQTSPLFFYSVIINNQSFDVAEQMHLLLGDNTLRVAPMALLSSGQILFMTFLAQAAASELVCRVAELTAELWADPESSEAFEFRPTIEETEAFIDTYWMPRTNKQRPSRDERRSGWRRDQNGG